MQYKQLIISVVLLLETGLTALQAQTLYIRENNGTQTVYTLSTVKKMTFASGNVTVLQSDNSTGIYALSELKYLSFQDLTTGIEEPLSRNNINLIIYPNPVNDLLNVDLTTANRNGMITILTPEGKVIQKQVTAGTAIATLDLSHLPHGLYLLRYNNATEIKTVKIIKQ